MHAACCEQALAKKGYEQWLDGWAQDQHDQATTGAERKRFMQMMRESAQRWSQAQDHLDTCEAEAPDWSF